MGEKRSAHSGAAGREAGADGPASVRNVALIGPSGAGKTSLVESLALAAGAVERAGRVADGTTLSDHDESEHRQHRSVQLSLTPLRWDGCRLNLLDTPGYADFAGELHAGLHAADAALFVVSAASPPDGTVRMLWRECEGAAIPRALVVTHLDAPQADFEATAEACRSLPSDGDSDAVAPLHLPLAADGAPTALAWLLSRRVGDYADGSRVERTPAAGQLPRIDEARGRLIESLIEQSEDEALMERYLAGEECDESTLVADLAEAVARGSFFPVLAAGPAPEGGGLGLGTRELLEFAVVALPGPQRRRPLRARAYADGGGAELACDPQGPLAASVVRTSTDPYVGRVSLVRVFSGTLRPDDAVHVAGPTYGEEPGARTAEERIGGLSTPFGARQSSVARAVAGDLVSVAKLSSAETGDTLSAGGAPLLLETWPPPEPLLPTAVEAHGRSDEDKLSHGLVRLVAEDPTMRLEQNSETGQLVLWCLGEAHLDVALERLGRRYGVHVDAVPYRVPLRQTFASATSARGRLVKQSGGHGQYAVCDITVEPLAEGAGIEFVDEVVGGAVPRQFVPSVEKGVRAQAERGVSAGRPLVDLRVRLTDGKAHPVDSSDAAFQTAGALALRECAGRARVRLLEPVAELTVHVGEEYVGAVMSDLSARRGRVLGTRQATDGSGAAVSALVPERELGRYAVDLRALSHGTGRFSRSHARHEPMPQQQAARILEADLDEG